MTGTINSPYTSEEMSVWLQGLLAMAWADGHFDAEEKNLIASLSELEAAPNVSLDSTSTLSPQDIAAVLDKNPFAAENFLRTAVMVAIADGVYSEPEDELLRQYCELMHLDETILTALRGTLPKQQLAPQTGSSQTLDAPTAEQAEFYGPHYKPGLKPVQKWLDGLEIHDPRLARFLCKMIPPQCPFERDVVVFGHKVVHIPAMCKINPLYEQLVGLRFRALSFLADECEEDVSKYC